MSLEDGKHRITKAVRCLVDEPGAIKDRLLIAFVSQLSGLDPPNDLPDELVVPFEVIQIRLNQDQVVGDRGNPVSQLEKISEQEACETAGKLFDMFLKLHDIAE